MNNDEVEVFELWRGVKRAHNAVTEIFLNGKYLQVASKKKKKKGTSLQKLWRLFDEQITSSTFSNILNPTSCG